MPGSILDADHVAINKIEKNPYLHRGYILGERDPWYTGGQTLSVCRVNIK